MKKEWFSAAELAAEALPGLPGSRQNIAGLALRQGWDAGALCRARTARGGGLEYHYSLLPDAAQAALVTKYGVLRREVVVAMPRRRQAVAVAVPAAGAATGGAGGGVVAAAPARNVTAWGWYDGLTNKQKDQAVQRLDALMRIDTLRRRMGRGLAIKALAEELDVAPATLHNWLDRVRGVARVDWLPALAPAKRGGGGREIEVQEEVWEAIRVDYLREAEASFSSCYKRLKRAAGENGWVLPPERTLRRHMATKIPEAVRVLAREGAEEAKKLYPAQKRDRSMFHALEAVNADGHKWDVFVRWPDGTIGRPVMIGFQDLYSGKIMSWRFGKSESRDMVRLAFGDMCMAWGIPKKCWFDNGKSFASKWLTGGTPNRYRFKVKAEEPLGILTQLGVEIHWTTPYHGQSKPVERAWLDMTQVARGPWFQGAYTGKSPMDKPADYGTRAIPFEDFKVRVDYEILMHNQETGRHSDVCGGKLSFNEAFDPSYAKAVADGLIVKPSDEQMRICLLAAEGVKPRQNDGSIHLLGNRYWHEALIGERGKMLTVRFDPDNVLTDLPVYRHDGTMVCMAELIEAVGFADTAAAREYNQARNGWLRSQKDMLKAQKMLSLADLVALQPKISVPVMPEAEIIRPAFKGNLAVKPQAQAEADQDEIYESMSRGLRLIERFDD